MLSSLMGQSLDLLIALTKMLLIFSMSMSLLYSVSSISNASFILGIVSKLSSLIMAMMNSEASMSRLLLWFAPFSFRCTSTAN